MKTLKTAVAAIAIATAALVPVAAPAAGEGYFIVSDYTTNADIIAGPFTYDGCQFQLLERNLKAPNHCAIKTW
jgi:hypothetical protein